jgi:DNA-binding NarL/FixJ family response regulator
LGSGLTVKEVAEGMRISKNTVQNHVRYALRTLRIHLSHEMGAKVQQLRVPLLWRYAWDIELVAKVFSGKNVLSEKHTKLAVALASGRFMKFVASELGITVYQAQGRLQEAEKRFVPSCGKSTGSPVD